MNNTNFLSEPRRQSKIALLFYVLKFLRTAFKTLWPLLIVLFINTKGNGGSDSYWLPIIVGIASFQLVSSIVSYFRFFYYSRDGELIIEKGVFQKTRLNIPFERIQTINFNQNILHQILDVYEVKIDTAGSAGTELSIEALDKLTAEAIRDYVMRERALLVEKKQVENEEDGVVEELSEEAPTLLFRRSERELLKIGMSENHIQTMFIIIGFGFGWLQFGDDFFDINYEDLTLSAIETIGGMLSIFIAALVVGFLFFVIIVSLIRTIIKYYRLSVFEDRSGFKIVAGLFNRKEQSAPYSKIQFMQWAVNPIQKRMDFRTIRLFQASSMAVAKSKALPMPGSSSDNLFAVRTRIFPEEDRQGYQLSHISPLIVLRRVLYFGVIPALLIALQAFLASNMYIYVLAALWIPLVWWMAKRYYDRYVIHMNEQVMELHSGIFGRKYTLLRLFKVQAVELSQSPYQRRKELANMELHTAAGAVKIPYVPMAHARSIRDYILYEVEREERDWM